MFEQTSRLAERLAASVSRRGFLGSLGGWAATAAMGVAGVLLYAGTARAANKYKCCLYTPAGAEHTNICIPATQSCPAFNCLGQPFDTSNLVDNCKTGCCRGAGNQCCP
jgi:hypothetical protein